MCRNPSCPYILHMFLTLMDFSFHFISLCTHFEKRFVLFQMFKSICFPIGDKSWIFLSPEEDVMVVISFNCCWQCQILLKLKWVRVVRPVRSLRQDLEEICFCSDALMCSRQHEQSVLGLMHNAVTLTNEV